MKPSDRLRNLGITLPEPQGPLGAYASASKVNNLVYVSGQLPVQNGGLAFTGKVGETLSVEEGKMAAALCFINTLASLESLSLSVDDVVQVVRLTGYVQAGTDFIDHPMVINGASELSLQVFGDTGIHARSAVGVASLPKGAAVELEAIFQIADR